MSNKQIAIAKDAIKETGRLHQPGQAVFKAILSEDIDWKPFAAFPAPVRLADIVGEPSRPGPYVIRVRVPPWREDDALIPPARILGGYGVKSGCRLVAPVLTERNCNRGEGNWKP